MADGRPARPSRRAGQVSGRSGLRGTQTAIGQVEKRLPVRRDGHVATAVILKGQISARNGRVERRQFGDAQVLASEQPVHRPGCRHGQELPLGIAPLVGQAAIDVDQAWRWDTYELLRRIPDLSCTKVVMVSALGELRDRLAAYDSGPVDYITKPFYTEEVLVKVRTWMRMAYSQEIDQLWSEIETTRDAMGCAGENGFVPRQGNGRSFGQGPQLFEHAGGATRDLGSLSPPDRRQLPEANVSSEPTARHRQSGNTRCHSPQSRTANAFRVRCYETAHGDRRRNPRSGRIADAADRLLGNGGRNCKMPP